MGIFGSLLKTAVGVVTLPVAVVADVVTMSGGENTAKNLAGIIEDATDVVEETISTVDKIL